MTLETNVNHDADENEDEETPRVLSVGTSRRRFLVGSTLAGVGTLGLGSGLVGAQDDDDDDDGDDNGDDDNDDGPDDDDDGPDDDDDDDDDDGISVLNFALTLEHLEHALYRGGLDDFDETDLTGTGLALDLLQDVRDHERAHVEALTTLIRNRGGTPVEEGSYDFGYETVQEFLAVAMLLENTGVAAYAGAAPRLGDDDDDDDNGDDDGRLLATLLSIHSVEARHAAFVNELNLENPFPDAFDRPLSRRETLDVVGQFVVG